MSQDSLDEANFSDIDERQPYLPPASPRQGSSSPSLRIQAPALSPVALTQTPHSHHPSPKRESDLPTRLYSFKQRADAKIKERRAEREKAELGNCTFSPDVKRDGRQRTLKEFLVSQKRFEGQRDRKVEEMRSRQDKQHEESELEVSMNKEHSIEKGHREVEKPGQRPVYERLCSSPRKQTQSPEHPHQPSLSPKSKRLKRQEKVEDILYKDAVRRMLKPAVVPSPTQKVTVNPHSEELLADAISREIEGAWTVLRLKFKATYLDVGKFLTELKYLTSNDRDLLESVWTTLKGKDVGYVSKSTLANFLFALNNLKTPARSVDTEDTDESEMMVINIEDLKTLRKKFRPLLENKKRAHLKPKPSHTDYTFKPHLSPGSRKIAEKWLKPLIADPLLPPTTDIVVRLKPKPMPEVELEKTSPEMTFRPVGSGDAKAYRPIPMEIRELSGPEILPEMIRIIPSSGSSMAEPQEAEEPLILMNVTLPTSELVQFSIYQDDEVEERVREFVEGNGLLAEDGGRILAEVRKYITSSDDK